jgi:hypothetical protein
MIIDRDYVYVFGPEWADELLNLIERDPLAQSTMAEYGLTQVDVRRYYLAPAHFNEIYHQLIDQGDDFVNDPVETLLYAIRMTKDTAGQNTATETRKRSSAYTHLLRRQIPPYFRLKPKSLMSTRNDSARQRKTGKVRNSLTLFLRLLTS